MRQQILSTGLLACALTFLPGLATASPTLPKEPQKRGKKVKPKRSVPLARSWASAVREAKLLKVPIVVHNHGFN